MKKLHHSEGPPCKVMENLLQDLATGKLRGIKRLYVIFHAGHCLHCGNFLKRMEVTVVTLKATKTDPDPESLKRLQHLLKEVVNSPQH